MPKTLSFTSGASPSAPFVTIGNVSNLSAERSLTGTANQINVTDNGANSTVVLSTPQDINTGASVTFGNVTDSAMTAQSILFAGAAGIIAQDTTQFLYDSLNHTLVFPGGTTATGASNAAIRSVTNNPATVNYFEVYSAAKATSSGAFSFIRGRGSFTAQVVPNSGDRLGVLDFRSIIATNTFGYGAEVVGEADGTITASSSQGRLRFLTQPSGTVAETGLLEAMRLDSSQNTSLAGKLVKYNNVTTSGYGVPAIFASGRATAQTAANASVSTYTLPATDGSFIVSANVLITTSTTYNFTVTCAYTDEGNTARTLTFNFSNVGGTLATAIANAGGAVPYEGIPLHIRCKASTAITIATTGTFTSVTYNVEGSIRQIS